MRKEGLQLGLGEYYLIEGLNAYGTTVFFLGVFFHARILHSFSDTQNLLLAATQGAAYVLATRAGGRFADRVGSIRSIVIGLCGMCLALLAGWQAAQGWVLFASIAIYSAFTALIWPALEAAIARAPGRLSLARRAGLYNITWSFTGSAGFFLGGALFAFDPEAVFWAPLAAHALELVGLALWSILPPRRRISDTEEPRPGGHLLENSATLPPTVTRLKAPLSPEAQARFLRAAWVANGLSYFLFGAFAALAPTLGARLGLGPRLAIWLVSTYLFARCATFVIFWFWDGWEYHRGPLAATLLLTPSAFAAVFVSSSAALVICSLALLGALSALAYSTSLHASLDREGREGEGGGLHEWVIGLGILLGPLAGAIGARVLVGPSGAGGLVTALGTAVALVGLVPLFRGRKSR